MPFDILQRRETSFLLWIPGEPPPDTARLVLGKWDSSRQDSFNQLLDEPLALSEGAPDLWELPCPSMIEKLSAEWKPKVRCLHLLVQDQRHVANPTRADAGH
jgi:hypothetical protein